MYSQRCHDVLDQGELGQAIDALEEWIHQAAKSAWMRQKCERKGPTVDHKPLFDKECLDAKHYLRSSIRRFGTSEETKELERKYHALVRGKKRQFMAQQVKSITRLNPTWDDPRAFRRTLTGNKRNTGSNCSSTTLGQLHSPCSKWTSSGSFPTTAFVRGISLRVH